MNKQPTEVHKYWLKTIESEYSDDLNDWEVGFVVQIRQMLNRGAAISDKQEASLEQLYEKATR